MLKAHGAKIIVSSPPKDEEKPKETPTPKPPSAEIKEGEKGDQGA